MRSLMGIAAQSAKLAKVGLVVAGVLLVGAPRAHEGPRPANVQFDAADWLEFDTNACGDVTRMESRHSRQTRLPAAYPDRNDDDNGDEWVNAWNMSPGESVMLNNWMLDHPEIATITVAVDKSCDEELPIDDSDGSDIA